MAKPRTKKEPEPTGGTSAPGADGIDADIEIEQWPVARLKPYAKNAKLHPPEQVAHLARIFARHGFDQPIVVDGKGIIVKGHGRWLAAKEAGMSTVPVVVRDLTKAQAAEARLADNRVAEFGWDFDAIVAEVVGNLEAGLDPEVTGFTLEQLGLEFKSGEVIQVTEPDTESKPSYTEVVEPETPKPPRKSVTKLGNLWQLGRHRLLCGDSTDEKARTAFLREKPDTIFTDPPYGVNYVSRVDEEQRKDWGGIANDDLQGEELVAFLRKAVPLDLATFAFVCCNWKCAIDFERALGKPKAVCVWDKGSFGLGRGYRSQHEFVFFYGTLNRTDLSDVWPFKRDARSDYQHPTQKPVALVAKALQDVKAQRVFDPFGGSGSTLLAAEQLGAICYTIELEPKYCDVIIERWQNLTGDKAQLLSGG